MAKTKRKPRAKSPDEVCLEPCSIEKGMRVIGGKWKRSILWHMKDGPTTPLQSLVKPP